MIRELACRPRSTFLVKIPESPLWRSGVPTPNRSFMTPIILRVATGAEWRVEKESFYSGLQREGLGRLNKISAWFSPRRRIPRSGTTGFNHGGHGEHGGGNTGEVTTKRAKGANENAGEPRRVRRTRRGKYRAATEGGGAMELRHKECLTQRRGDAEG